MGFRCLQFLTTYFNPRSPHGERPFSTPTIRIPSSFQSTLPAWGATTSRTETNFFIVISIHAPRMGSDVGNAEEVSDFSISIHAPRMGSDTASICAMCWTTYFNPRSPHGERPLGGNSESHVGQYFNPRSPHGERRERTVWKHPSVRYFNPRSPHGERPRAQRWNRLVEIFQSTLPAWGATRMTSSRSDGASAISIHAPRMGSDHASCGVEQAHRRFQSTLPAWGATLTNVAISCGNENFNPRSPHGERQRKVTILSIRIIDFAQKVYHKTVLLRISLAENAVILPEKPRNPVRTSLQKAGGLRFARAIRAARPYSISSPSGA